MARLRPSTVGVEFLARVMRVGILVAVIHLSNSACEYIVFIYPLSVYMPVKFSQSIVLSAARPLSNGTRAEKIFSA